MASSSDRLRRAYKQYENEGYTTVTNAIDDTLVARARSHIDWLLQHNPDKEPEELTQELMARDAFWLRLVSDDRLLDIVEEFIGQDIALFSSHYIAKPPGGSQSVLWHQDGVYWPLEPKKDVLTVWLALDQTRPSNGCMQVIPGSQTLELQDIEENTDVDNVLNSRIDMEIDKTDAIPIELEPGDISIHHPNILHGSSANTSYNWRRGLTIRYIPATTSILAEEFDEDDDIDDEWPAAFMLRGEAEPGVNTYQPWPRVDEYEHMPFDGEEAYDRRAVEMNERVAEAGLLSEKPIASTQ